MVRVIILLRYYRNDKTAFTICRGGRHNEEHNQWEELGTIMMMVICSWWKTTGRGMRGGLPGCLLPSRLTEQRKRRSDGPNHTSHPPSFTTGGNTTILVRDERVSDVVPVRSSHVILDSPSPV
mmetsp:Transcript_31037/g.34772  ORF Transcript_31037/g.34772 Transcript_31037/m.34772 type:complete len:123 (+) Transcript_31037:138-506(+)